MGPIVPLQQEAPGARGIVVSVFYLHRDGGSGYKRIRMAALVRDLFSYSAKHAVCHWLRWTLVTGWCNEGLT